MCKWFVPRKGPAFWGLINPEWSLCNKGRRQSPVNLEPSRLLYDPNLRLLHIDNAAVISYPPYLPSLLHHSLCAPQIHGSIANTGHSVVFTVDNTTTRHVNITGGPLSYRYQFHEIHIHFGLMNDAGSEHTVNGYAFPAE
ncbi:hypothetical protein J437_LFUL001522, partial [Ladona fulva]